MAINEIQAKQILEAFGPCTNVYECYTVEELIEDAADHKPELDPAEYVALLLRVQKIKWERDDEAASYRQLERLWCGYCDTESCVHSAEMQQREEQQAKETKRWRLAVGLRVSQLIEKYKSTL